MNRLAGKVAIITGAARGMGEATARLFAAQGARVVLADVLDAPGESVARDIGDAAFFQHLDVRDEQAWQAITAAAVRRFGGVDVLVNNAAILKTQSLLDLAKEDFEQVLAVNLLGAFLGIKTVAPYMLKRHKGSIINISSVSAMMGQATVGAYAASKWGLRGLTRVAAVELGPRGVRVNSVYPGATRTQMILSHSSTEAIDRFAATIPMGRTAEPDEIASASLFLASDESSYVCGAELLVDGGLIAGRP